MGGGEGPAGERMEAPGFFVVRDSLASSVFTHRRNPKTKSPQPTAATVPSSLQTLPPGLAGCVVSCPPPSRVTIPEWSASLSAPSTQGGYTRPRTAWGSHLPTRRGFSRTTGFAVATPSSGGSPPAPNSVPTSKALREVLALLRLWGVPFGFLALATSPRAHRYSGAPTWGSNRARKGQSARKVSASGTASSLRASESLRNFVSRASESAFLSACARAHTLTHLHTNTSTCTPRAGLKTSARFPLFPGIPLSS